MAQSISLKSSIQPSDISLTVICPGCGHQHSFSLSRPVTTRNCSYQKGTFTATLSTSILKPGRLSLVIEFTGEDRRTSNITEKVLVEVQGQTVN